MRKLGSVLSSPVGRQVREARPWSTEPRGRPASCAPGLGPPLPGLEPAFPMSAGTSRRHRGPHMSTCDIKRRTYNLRAVEGGLPNRPGSVLPQGLAHKTHPNPRCVPGGAKHPGSRVPGAPGCVHPHGADARTKVTVTPSVAGVPTRTRDDPLYTSALTSPVVCPLQNKRLKKCIQLSLLFK